MASLDSLPDTWLRAPVFFLQPLVVAVVHVRKRFGHFAILATGRLRLRLMMLFWELYRIPPLCHVVHFFTLVNPVNQLR